jgi:hypothetical protein
MNRVYDTLKTYCDYCASLGQNRPSDAMVLLAVCVTALPMLRWFGDSAGSSDLKTSCNK